METAAQPFGGELVAAAEEGGGRRSKRAAQLLELSHEAALQAVGAVAASVDSRDDLPAFFARVGQSIAELTHARRAAFWRLGSHQTLTVQPVPFAFRHDSTIYDARIQLGKGQGAIERLVFHDELELQRGTSPALDSEWQQCGLREVQNSIAAAWRTDGRHLGLIAVYDADSGFTAQDRWLLRIAGLTAGLLWQYRESRDELARIGVRLEAATAARRHLLNNIAAGGDEARRRFANALHDDSLQLLTAAELQLERVRADSNGSPLNVQLDRVGVSLRRVEDSLRRLLTNVSPEAPPAGDLREGISERLESLRVRAGIESYVDSRLPDDLSFATQSVVLKNVGEALNNIEKHARATRVAVVAEQVDRGVRVEVSDDGTGFVVGESVRLPGHIGLVAMRERAVLAGGWCRVESEPGIGTRVEFWIPMNL